DKNEEVSALYNARTTSYWDWIRWRKSDLKPTSDKRYKWYFQNQKWDADKDINFRNINSSSDKNSIALFRFNRNVDI
ncbi:MAG: hypothetical protein IJ970_00645, partial [Mycoplasmataceae bacterium]|nr:hypothetical protein [Mycoplasmataceae bacterium]